MKRARKITKIRERRAIRARAKIFGTSARPRLSVFRSNRATYCQLIDDTKGITIASASSRDKEFGTAKGKANLAHKLGEKIAKLAADKKVLAVVFDRGSYKYHGRVKAVADGARAGGLKV